MKNVNVTKGFTKLRSISKVMKAMDGMILMKSFI